MQETEKINLPVSGGEVLIRGYVTGLIDQEYRKVLAGSNKARYEVDTDNIDTAQTDQDELPKGGKMVMETDPTAQIKADNKLLELMVLAVNGENGDVLNKLLALPAQDVQVVADRVKAIKAAGEVGTDEKKETNSSAITS